MVYFIRSENNSAGHLFVELLSFLYIFNDGNSIRKYIFILAYLNYFQKAILKFLQLEEKLLNYKFYHFLLYGTPILNFKFLKVLGSLNESLLQCFNIFNFIFRDLMVTRYICNYISKRKMSRINFSSFVLRQY